MPVLGKPSRLIPALEGCSSVGVCFALYAFSTSFDFVAVLPGVSVGRISALLLLAVLLFNLGIARFPKRPYVAFALGFLFVDLIVLLLMSSPLSGINSLMPYALNILIFLLIAGLPATKQDCELCEWSLVLSALCMCVLMATNPGSVGAEWTTERVVVNIAGSQQDPNQFCGYFLFAIAFCVYGALRKGRVLLFAIAALCFYSVLLTGSRGGLIACMVTCLFAVVFGLRGSKHKLFYIAVAVFLAVVLVANFDAVLSLLPASVASRFTDVSLDSGTASLRTRAWTDIIQAYAASDLLHQLFGHGYGSTTSVTFNGLVAHNTYLEVLYSFGLFGLLLFASLVASCFFLAWRAKRYALLAAMLGFCALLFTLTDSSSKTFWVMLTLSVMWFELGRNSSESCLRGLKKR